MTCSKRFNVHRSPSYLSRRSIYCIYCKKKETKKQSSSLKIGLVLFNVWWSQVCIFRQLQAYNKHFFSVCTSQGTAPWVVNPNPQLHPTLSSLWAPPPKENYPTNHTNQIKTTKNQSQSLKIIQSLSFRTWRIQLEAYNLNTENFSS